MPVTYSIELPNNDTPILQSILNLLKIEKSFENITVEKHVPGENNVGFLKELNNLNSYIENHEKHQVKHQQRETNHKLGLVKQDDIETLINYEKELYNNILNIHNSLLALLSSSNNGSLFNIFIQAIIKAKKRKNTLFNNLVRHIKTIEQQCLNDISIDSITHDLSFSNIEDIKLELLENIYGYRLADASGNFKSILHSYKDISSTGVFDVDSNGDTKELELYIILGIKHLHSENITTCYYKNHKQQFDISSIKNLISRVKNLNELTYIIKLNIHKSLANVISKNISYAVVQGVNFNSNNIEKYKNVLFTNFFLESYFNLYAWVIMNAKDTIAKKNIYSQHLMDELIDRDIALNKIDFYYYSDELTVLANLTTRDNINIIKLLNFEYSNYKNKVFIENFSEMMSLSTGSEITFILYKNNSKNNTHIHALYLEETSPKFFNQNKIEYTSNNSHASNIQINLINQDYGSNEHGEDNKEDVYNIYGPKPDFDTNNDLKVTIPVITNDIIKSLVEHNKKFSNCFNSLMFLFFYKETTGKYKYYIVTTNTNKKKFKLNNHDFSDVTDVTYRTNILRSLGLSGEVSSSLLLYEISSDTFKTNLEISDSNSDDYTYVDLFLKEP